MATIRPNAEPAATTVAAGDIFLIDGSTGVRALAATSVPILDASGNVSINNVIAGFTSTATAAGTTTLTVTSAGQQFFTGTLGQTVVLPVVSTLKLGQGYFFQNSSTGSVTVQSSGGNVVKVLGPGTFCEVTCIALTGTSAASWQATSQVPNPSATTLGGIQSITAVTHKWLNSISTAGVPTLTQPDATDVTFTQVGTGAVATTLQSKSGQILSVKDFGAKGNAISVTATVTIGSGSPNLLATGASFTAADVGKTINIPGAGAAGAVLLTTILTFTDATHVVLAANAGTAVTAVSTRVIYGTDDIAAINAAQAAAVASASALFWPNGNYLFSILLNFSNANTRHSSLGGVTLTFAGSGAAITMDAGATSGNLYDITFGSREAPFKIVGNPNAVTALFMRGVHQSCINIIARDFTSCALNLNFSVCSRFYVKMSVNDGGAFNVQPAGCMFNNVRSAGEYTTDCDFEIIAEGISGTGLQLSAVHGCRFTGTSEGNIAGGGGVFEGASCFGNYWDRFDCEANAGADWTLAGTDQTELNHCGGGSTVGMLVQTSSRTRIIGGQFSTINVDSGSGHTRLEDVNYLVSWTINSTTATWRGIVNGSGVYLADKSTGPSIAAPTYANSWVDFGGGIEVGGYYQSADGIVHLCGTIKSGTVGSKAFTLPAGMRPLGTLFFTAFNPSVGTPSFMIQVNATGDVIPQSGVNSGCALDGVSFLGQQ